MGPLRLIEDFNAWATQVSVYLVCEAAEASELCAQVCWA
ncbi:predicted protein [Plenodomus lingam JN3]|uniref:Predicted protein n=1 Tax=Leptosphaeria maculans (strain JN3 / isolate v23.1.3 / race Av1-4-5-6-7-8) TaxID=985895 RepID=E5AFQ0_LEPMJ|nr:predicted protein [Plenodomus lingam JN3]CBY02039.1 predicted protein [Plenodomus lingam JN3]